MKEPPASVLSALARHDSPTVCNVIELCNVRPRNSGYFSPRIRAVYPELPPMVGYAVTATFRSAAAVAADEKPLGMLDQIRLWQGIPAPRVLVIQDLDDPPDGAVYGEIVASVLKGFGFAGLVTNGYARDVLQVRQLDFPCFATGTSVSHAYCRVLSVGQPVSVGGVLVRPGDLIHGDANGVTTIPLEIADRVAAGCAEVVEAENILIHGARESGLTPEKFAQTLDRFFQKHNVIARTLSGQDSDRKLGV